MRSEGYSGFPKADCHSNIDTLGHGYLSEAAILPLHACQARNRAAEPDFETGQERKWHGYGENTANATSHGPAQ